ncbi:MAG: nucleotide pyrophosphohydrolase [Thermotogota bacterium]
MSKEYDNLMKIIRKFVEDRNWDQFHYPKDLAISLNLEAAELLECFQWKNNEEVEKMVEDENEKEHIEEEIADVAIYLMQLAHSLDIDLKEAIETKMKKNAIKYPLK